MNAGTAATKLKELAAFIERNGNVEGDIKIYVKPSPGGEWQDGRLETISVMSSPRRTCLFLELTNSNNK